MPPLAWKEDSNEERYEDHINSILQLWDCKFKVAYLPSLSRVLGLNKDHTNNLIEVAVILHDAGKLFVDYQKSLREGRKIIGYRHEIVSAALVSFILTVSEEIHLVSGAILLHHEPILMGQVSKYAEPYLTITDIERRLRHTCGDIIQLDPEGVEWTCKKLQSYPFKNWLPGEIKLDYVLEKIKEIMMALCIKCSSQQKSSLRLKVSSLGTLLSILDSVAANEKRKSSDDGGTFITRRAEKAEVSLAWL